MVDAVGPVYVGGFEEIATDEGDRRYTILYLPDKHNSELQREGKPPVYYWMPSSVRLATLGNTKKFHLLQFKGVLDPETHAGVEERVEIVGGVLSLTTTMAPPPSVLENAHKKAGERFSESGKKNDRYWGWRVSAAPMFRSIPIHKNVTAITNLSPNSDGAIPAAGGGGGGASPEGPPGEPGGGASPEGPPGEPGVAGPPGEPREDEHIEPRSSPLEIRYIPNEYDKPISFTSFREPPNLDLWLWKLQGQGPGSILATGENAFSGLIGSIPTAILWQGFRGLFSPISVIQALKIKVWTTALIIRIEGNWDRLFSHFSAAGEGGNFWWNVDIKTEINKLIINGGIKVTITIDGTVPSAEKMRAEVNKYIDPVVNAFTSQATQVIFVPAPQVTPAQAKKKGGIFGLMGLGGGFALNYRRDEAKLTLDYTVQVDEAYYMDHVISSTLEGFFDEIKQDPDAERKYFSTLFLDDWARKVTRIVKPIVNWPDASKKWVGDPVSFLSVQIGYPSTRGDIQWAGHVFQSTDTGDSTTWSPAVIKKQTSEVVNAPSGWTPDTTFVRRAVHFNEPPGESDSEFIHTFVEKNKVDLDPEPNGSLTNQNAVEVRVDSVGKLEVGPISLNVELESPKQVVEVDFRALGKKHDGTDRAATRFTWTFDNQKENRYWEIFTGQLDYVPRFVYKVHVIVKGSIFSSGMEWFGPEVEVVGNGAITVSVPTADAPGVTRRNLVEPMLVHSAGGPPPGEVSVAVPPPSSIDDKMEDQYVAPYQYSPRKSSKIQGFDINTKTEYVENERAGEKYVGKTAVKKKNKEEKYVKSAEVVDKVEEELELTSGWKTSAV